jgi:hypothetical protein
MLTANVPQPSMDREKSSLQPNNEDGEIHRRPSPPIANLSRSVSSLYSVDHRPSVEAAPVITAYVPPISQSFHLEADFSAIQQAAKLTRHATSALMYEDVATAISLLENTLAILHSIRNAQ